MSQFAAWAEPGLQPAPQGLRTRAHGIERHSTAAALAPRQSPHNLSLAAVPSMRRCLCPVHAPTEHSGSTVGRQRIGHLVPNRLDLLQVRVDRSEIGVRHVAVYGARRRRQDRPALAHVSNWASLISRSTPDSGSGVRLAVKLTPHGPNQAVFVGMAVSEERRLKLAGLADSLPRCPSPPPLGISRPDVSDDDQTGPPPGHPEVLSGRLSSIV